MPAVSRLINSLPPLPAPRPTRRVRRTARVPSGGSETGGFSSSSSCDGDVRSQEVGLPPCSVAPDLVAARPRCRSTSGRRSLECSLEDAAVYLHPARRVARACGVRFIAVQIRAAGAFPLVQSHSQNELAVTSARFFGADSRCVIICPLTHSCSATSDLDNSPCGCPLNGHCSPWHWWDLAQHCASAPHNRGGCG